MLNFIRNHHHLPSPPQLEGTVSSALSKHLTHHLLGDSSAINTKSVSPMTSSSIIDRGHDRTLHHLNA